MFPMAVIGLTRKSTAVIRVPQSRLSAVRLLRSVTSQSNSVRQSRSKRGKQSYRKLFQCGHPGINDCASRMATFPLTRNTLHKIVGFLINDVRMGLTSQAAMRDRVSIGRPCTNLNKESRHEALHSRFDSKHLASDIRHNCSMWWRH